MAGNPPFIPKRHRNHILIENLPSSRDEIASIATSDELSMRPKRASKKPVRYGKRKFDVSDEEEDTSDNRSPPRRPQRRKPRRASSDDEAEESLSGQTPSEEEDSDIEMNGDGPAEGQRKSRRQAAQAGQKAREKPTWAALGSDDVGGLRRAYICLTR
jgi:hypothetical protein